MMYINFLMADQTVQFESADEVSFLRTILLSFRQKIFHEMKDGNNSFLELFAKRVVLSRLGDASLCFL